MFIKIFQISSEIFWGWRCKLDIDTYDTSEKIILRVKNELVKYLHDGNLLNMVDKARDLKLHIHESEDKIICRDDKIVYLCDHCNI